MIKLYFKYIILSFKSSLEYKLDFFVSLFSSLAEQIISLLTIGLIFNSIPNLNGWMVEEIILMYAIAMLGRSVDLIFFNNFWKLGWKYIRNGNFDQLLVKPVSVLFQICVTEFEFNGLSYVFTGLITLIYSINELGIVMNMLNILILLIFIISVGFIYGAINLILSTLSFWIIDSTPLMMITFSFSDMARYPISIFPTIIQGMLTFILPYAFTGFYPATYFLVGDHHSSISLLTPVIAIVFSIVAVLFFNYGVNKYVGAGS